MRGKYLRGGFTLIELLVVIAIIGILSGVVLASLNGARIKSRDGQRAAELRQVANALELYYNSNGHYPITNCTSPDLNWASFDSPTYSPRKICSTVGVAGVNTFAEEMQPYISAIADPKSLGSDSGYLYTSSDGAKYCFMIFKTPEDLRHYQPNLINPYRCGSGNTSATCSAAGTSGSTANSIFIGTGSYATAGC